MKTVTGKVVKETFVGDEFYYLQISWGQVISIDDTKFTDVDEYVNQTIKCKVIVWDHTQTENHKYRIIGKA